MQRRKANTYPQKQILILCYRPSIDAVCFCLSTLCLTKLPSSKGVHFDKVKSYRDKEIAQIQTVRARLDTNDKVIFNTGKPLQRGNEFGETLPAICDRERPLIVAVGHIPDTNVVTLLSNIHPYMIFGQNNPPF